MWIVSLRDWFPQKQQFQSYVLGWRYFGVEIRRDMQVIFKSANFYFSSERRTCERLFQCEQIIPFPPQTQNDLLLQIICLFFFFLSVISFSLEIVRGMRVILWWCGDVWGWGWNIRRSKISLTLLTATWQFLISAWAFQKQLHTKYWFSKWILPKISPRRRCCCWYCFCWCCCFFLLDRWDDTRWDVCWNN